MSITMISKNRKAYHNFEILDKFEAGIVLCGTEIKSVRESHVTFKDSYVDIKNNEAYLVGFYIAQYTFGNRWNHEEERRRKLLLHKQEIIRLYQKIREKGLTLVPLSIYIKNGKAKMSIGLGKGKNLFDKRDSLKKKDQKRELDRVKFKYQ